MSIHQNSREAREQIKPVMGAQQRMVYDFLLHNGPLTRKDLESYLALGTGSINPRVKELLAKGLIEEVGSIVQRNGRKASQLDIVREKPSNTTGDLFDNPKAPGYHFRKK